MEEGERAGMRSDFVPSLRLLNLNFRCLLWLFIAKDIHFDSAEREVAAGHAPTPT
jgi:hypothetical protein